jgi:hypothetical protein
MLVGKDSGGPEMSSIEWNPWKVAVIGIAVVVTTVLVTAAVVGNWGNREASMGATKPAPIASNPKTTTRHGATTAPAPAQAQAPAPATALATTRTPSAADIEACNQHAKSVTTSDTAKDVLTKGVIGGALGAGVGAAGGAIAGGGKGAGKGAAIGGVVGATAGTIFGLNDANKADDRSVEAYRACMRERGYTN